MEPLISIIVPVYNVEASLPCCVNSLITQTYTNIEIILIDDGSTDSSGILCDVFAAKDSRIKVIHQENKGVSASRNKGLSVFAGSYLTFVDSDDYLSPDALEYLYGRIVSDGTQMVVGQIIEEWYRMNRINDTYSWMNNEILSGESAMLRIGGDEEIYGYCCGKLYCRALFEDLRFPSLTCCEDIALLPDILKRCCSISISSKVVYHYVQRDSSVLHTMSERHISDAVKARIEIARKLLDYNLRDNARRLLARALITSMAAPDKKEIRKLILNRFTRREMLIVFPKNLGALGRWIVLCFPTLYRPVHIVCLWWKRVFRRL